MDASFDGAGALMQAYRAVDWASTALGTPDTWSPALDAAVALALDTRFPVTLLWGPELVLVYNDAYTALIGDKHPAALGAPARDVFPEVWDTIGPLLHGVLKGDDATWVEDAQLFLDRHGYAEECFFTFSYSAVGDGRDHIEGVIDIATETTRRVIGQRRTETVTALAVELAAARSRSEIVVVALDSLASAAPDLVDVDLAVPGVRAASWFEGDTDDLPSGVPTVQADATGSFAVLPLDTRWGFDDRTVLVGRLSPHLPVDDEYLAFISLLGAMLTQALQRAYGREVEQRLRDAERAMSEAMQRSLLEPPADGDGLAVAVRYVAAFDQVQIGGDWYDSFPLASGEHVLVVGDVTGHDQDAAASMAQARNLLRGSELALPQTPAEALARLDDAVGIIDTTFHATAVVAHLARTESGHRFVWSNAGHPPPILLTAAGEARLLTSNPEPLLGTNARLPRSDHQIDLAAGDTVVLYTDGLFERRGEVLDVGFERLLAAVDGRGDLTPDELCEHVLATMKLLGDDDVVLLVARVS